MRISDVLKEGRTVVLSIQEHNEPPRPVRFLKDPSVQQIKVLLKKTNALRYLETFDNLYDSDFDLDSWGSDYEHEFDFDDLEYFAE